MSSWQIYVDHLMSNGACQDSAIVGCNSDSKYVWAAHAGGAFNNITVKSRARGGEGEGEGDLRRTGGFNH
uniref:Profilin n=1 Tax=Pygocentrus nattereri TaxID=42514 RepID=A0A3B4CID2_PYGNA